MTTTLKAKIDDAPADGSLLDLGPIRRAPRISRDDVYRAADELLVAGQRPTIDRVRVKLGRGSPNTINEYMDAWWAKLGSRLRDLPDRQFPALPEAVASTLHQLWNTALESAHEVLGEAHAAKEVTFSDREAALSHRESEQAEHERLAAVREASLEESLTSARSQLRDAQQHAASLDAALKARDAEHRDLGMKLNRLEDEKRAVEEKRESERVKFEQRLAGAESRWMGEVDRARQELKDAQKRASANSDQLAKLRGEQAIQAANLMKAEAELSASARARDQLERQLLVLSSNGRKVKSAPRSKPLPRKSAVKSKN